MNSNLGISCLLDSAIQLRKVGTISLTWERTTFIPSYVTIRPERKSDFPSFPPCTVGSSLKKSAIKGSHKTLPQRLKSMVFEIFMNRGALKEPAELNNKFLKRH